MKTAKKKLDIALNSLKPVFNTGVQLDVSLAELNRLMFGVSVGRINEYKKNLDRTLTLPTAKKVRIQEGYLPPDFPQVNVVYREAQIDGKWGYLLEVQL